MPGKELTDSRYQRGAMDLRDPKKGVEGGDGNVKKAPYSAATPKAGKFQIAPISSPPSRRQKSKCGYSCFL